MHFWTFGFLFSRKETPTDRDIPAVSDWNFCPAISHSNVLRFSISVCVCVCVCGVYKCRFMSAMSNFLT